MQENTNKAIAVNSLIMYARMGINTILALCTTRYALQALGVIDYGLFSALGSIISFMGVFNTIMISTCHRFIAVAIGRGDQEEINKTFNINLAIFLGCALILLVVGLPLGDWYVRHHINYDGSLENVLMVFYFAVIGSTISTLATPYNGLLIAKERFFMFSFVDVAIHFLRFGVVMLLVYYFENKLFIYTLLQASTVALPALTYGIYCRIKFPDIVRYKFVRDKSAYKEVFKFSGWVSVGAIACVVRNQAAALLVNGFFNTVMNTALGIANSLNHYVTLFANSITQPMQPQITKSYAAGNYQRTDELLVMSTKLGFLLMVFVGCPFFVSAEWLIHLWLGQVPAYAVSFTILLIIDNIVMSFNSGLSLLVFADGRIAKYQIAINTLRIASVIVGYFVLKAGTKPELLFICYIVFSLFIVLASQWCVKTTLVYNFKNLFRNAYLPSAATVVCLMPVIYFTRWLSPLMRIIVCLSYYVILVYIIGLNKKEQKFLKAKVSILINRK